MIVIYNCKSFMLRTLKAAEQKKYVIAVSENICVKSPVKKIV
jgi:hypothetical protein